MLLIEGTHPEWQNSPIYCFGPQVPFLGLLEALLWRSSEQAAFGWRVRSTPSPIAAPRVLPALVIIALAPVVHSWGVIV